MTAGRAADRDPFRALLLGIVGSGHRLRTALDDGVTTAAPLAVPRPLAPADLAVLGLLGFHARIEALLTTLAPEMPHVADAADAPASLPVDLLR